MKKFFAIAFIAATMVACNNSSDKTETTDDSTKVETPAMDQDTTNMAPATSDTTSMAPATEDTTGGM